MHPSSYIVVSILLLGVSNAEGKSLSKHKTKLIENDTVKQKDATERWLDGCGISKYSDATTPTALSVGTLIVGGDDAREGELPWQVSLYAGGAHSCGGVLIDDKWVLTAAHCVEYPSSTYKIVLGDHDITSVDDVQQDIPVSMSDICVHESYSSSPMEWDIAIIRLPGGAEINDDVKPACAPDEDDDVTGEMCTVSGWGRTDAANGKSETLKYLNIPVIAQDECKELYQDSQEIYDTNLCAGYTEGGRDACQGDSGGPLVCQNDDDSFTLYGIVSRGDGCALPNKPGIYTRVQSFLDWIDEKRSRYNSLNVC